MIFFPLRVLNSEGEVKPVPRARYAFAHGMIDPQVFLKFWGPFWKTSTLRSLPEH